MPSLWQVFSPQVLNNDSDISEGHDVRCAAETYLEAMNYGEIAHHNEVWQAPKGLLSVQTLPLHIAQHLH